jgi:hypothetical protein
MASVAAPTFEVTAASFGTLALYTAANRIAKIKLSLIG